MGQTSSKQRKKQQVRAKTKRQVESMYKMFDQTIDVVRRSRFILSDYDRSKGLVSCSQLKNTEKINNLQDVLQQLLCSFTNNCQYSWGGDIYKQFRHHFRHCFEEVWPINKEEFYQIILSQCRFETIDFQNQLEEVAKNMDMQIPNLNRLSYKQLFYEVGAGRLEGHLPSSFISQNEQFSEDFQKQTKQEKEQFNLNAINATIINGDHKPDQFLTSYFQPVKQEQDQQQDFFIPLFLKTEKKSSNKKKIQQSSKIKLPQVEYQQQKRKRLKKMQEARIQNSSVIMPQTIFLNRLNDDARNEIGDLVRFYKEFSNALQRLFFSVSLISSPLKHFLFVFNQKLNRKNIKSSKNTVKKNKNSISQHYSTRSKIEKQLLFGQSKESVQYRQRRQINNNFILEEIRDFTEAYTQFIWKYLQLSEITQLKLGKMISVQNLYGTVLKSVWKFVQLISERGSEYQEWKIQQLYTNRQIPNRTKITQEKKRYLMRILKKLMGEHNPQKYLKKIVVFYREVSLCGTCADDLLNIYQQLLVNLIKQGKARELGIFRMKNVIQKVLKIDENYNGGGEIGYSWITWCVIVQKLKGQIQRKFLNRKQSQKSQIQTQPDNQCYYQEKVCKL